MSWENGITALKKDVVIGPLIKKYGVLTPSSNKSFANKSNASPSYYFSVLVSSIVSQQISGKAAQAIMARIRKRCKPLTPKTVAAISLAELKTLGLSSQKASYVADLAGKFIDGTIKTKQFPTLSDEEISTELVQVKGIGLWTAQMFLIFSLDRVDVWPVGDYGVQKAVQVQFRKRALPTKQFMESVGKKWKPYRSVAALYLWKSLENR